MPIIALLVLSLLWGSTFYFTKLLLPDFHPVSIVFFRCLFGGLVLLPFFLRQKEKPLLKRLPRLAFITLLSAGVPWVFMSFSLRNLDTTISAVLNATGPVFGLLITVFLLKVKVNRQEILSVVVGFTGIFIAFVIGSASSEGFRLSSAMLLLFAVSLYAMSAVLTGEYLTGYSVYTLSFVTMVVGTLYSGPIMLMVDPYSFQGMMDLRNVGGFVMLGALNSGVGNLLYYYIVKSSGAIFALSITYLMPITTIFLGFILLNEPLGIGTIIALFFVLLSVYLSKRKGGEKMKNFQQTVSTLMVNNFSIDKTVNILILTDYSTEQLGRKFGDALEKDGWQISTHIMADRTKSGEEPPEETVAEMLKYELVFCLTKYSLTHTVARKSANAKGISVITMPGITEDMFLNGAMAADYSVVEKETHEMTAKLTGAKTVTIRTGEQHELVIPVEGRDGVPSTGVYRTKAASGNLPSGEAYIAPIEGATEGSIEINGSISGIGLLEEPVILTIEKGRLVNASGNNGEILLGLLGEGDGRFLCELGIGTNHAARLTGNILEDEKAYNTIHVAFGSNHTFGGTIKTNVHIDCVTKNPIVEWD